MTDAKGLALATGAAAYRWEDLTKAPVSPSMLLNPGRYGDGAKDLWTTLNCVQENIIRGGQRDRSRGRPDGSRMSKSRAIKGIDEDMKLNKSLWEMAEVLRKGQAQENNGSVPVAFLGYVLLQALSYCNPLECRHRTRNELQTLKKTLSRDPTSASVENR